MEMEAVEENEIGLFEYQDLANFLPESFCLDEFASPALQNKSRRAREITSFRMWLEAWNIYKSGLVLRAPHIAADLDAYLSFIKKASSLYSWKSVYAYDVAFRMKVSEGQATACWDVDPELQELMFIIPQHRVKQALAVVCMSSLIWYLPALIAQAGLSNWVALCAYRVLAVV